MPEWKKASQEATEMFERLLPEGPEIQKKKMFGYPCSFVKGNMFMGLFADDLFIRLSVSDREEFLEIEGAGQLEPMPGRPMKEYVVIPRNLLNEPDELNKWIDRSLKYILGLPPKKKKD